MTTVTTTTTSTGGEKKNFFCCTFNLKQTLELHRHVCVRVCPPHFISPLASHNLTTTAPHRKWLRSGSPPPNQQDQISVSLSVSAGVRWCRLINSLVVFQRSVPSNPTTPDSTSHRPPPLDFLSSCCGLLSTFSSPDDDDDDDNGQSDNHGRGVKESSCFFFNYNY